MLSVTNRIAFWIQFIDFWVFLKDVPNQCSIANPIKKSVHSTLWLWKSIFNQTFLMLKKFVINYLASCGFFLSTLVVAWLEVTWKLTKPYSNSYFNLCNLPFAKVYKHWFSQLYMCMNLYLTSFNAGCSGCFHSQQIWKR